MSTNTSGSKLTTHQNLKDLIAALERRNQQKNSPPTSPNMNATSSSPDPSLATTHSNSNGNSNTKGSLRDKIARFEAAGGTPIPRGSFGMGAMPSHDDDISRRKGEMFGNRVPGLNRPKVLPTEGLGMVSKSHLTVKPVAKESVSHHGRGESQSLGSHHRRFTSQSSYSAFTSPSLSAYDGEGGVGLSEVDEFGGLNGLGYLQTPYSPASTSPSLPSPEVTAVDKLPGKVVIPNKFQRRIVSDSQAIYRFPRALTPDPETPLQPLEEETPLASADVPPPPEVGSIPWPQKQDDPKELEVRPHIEPIPKLQLSTSETPLLPSPIDSSQGDMTDTAPEPTTPVAQVSEPIPEPTQVASVEEEDVGTAEDNRRPLEIVQATQNQDRDPDSEVPKQNCTSIPSSPAMDSADVPSSVSPKDATLSTPTLVADSPVIGKGEQPTEPVEETFLSVNVTRGSDDVVTHEETTAPPLAFPLPPINAPPIDDASSQLQTPPESPKTASSILTLASDRSDSTIDYRSVSSHPDPDHDLFVLPLPKDDELPPRPIIQEVVPPRSIHHVLTAPSPTLQTPVDFPITMGGSVSTSLSDPNISFIGDESLAMDASQAEIVIAQSEIIRPASPTLLVTIPSPSPTVTAFRMQTPPPPEESLPPLDEADDTQVSPPRIRKKLYTNHSVPTGFADTLSSPPAQRSFSAVVHQKTRSSAYILSPDEVDSPIPKPPNPANVFMTPKKKRSLFAESMVPASPGSELAFLAQSAAILEARLGDGGGSTGEEEPDEPEPTNQSVLLPTEPLPGSTLGSGATKVKSASTPALVSTSMATLGHTSPVPDLVYDDRSSNSGFSLNPQIPSFLPRSRSRKSGAHEEADRKSLAPSHKSRKSEKSPREKDKDSIPRARKLSSRLRSLANSSSNSLRSLGRPSMSSETSVSFDSPTTVSIEPMTPQSTGGGENGRLRVGFGSPGSRSQTSQGSGSEWNSPPKGRDILGRASSFADRLLSRTMKAKSGFLESSQDSASTDYLSPMRTSTISGWKYSRESQRGTSMKEKYGTTIPRTTSPPRVEIPSFGNGEMLRTPTDSSNSSEYLSTGLKALPAIPLTPTTPDSSLFFDTSELFDAFPSVPQNLPAGPGTSLLGGFEFGTSSDLGLGGGLGKPATISSSYRSTSQTYQ